MKINSFIQISLVLNRVILAFKQLLSTTHEIWDKVFKSGPSKNCERQPLKNLKGYGLLKQTILKNIIFVNNLKVFSK